jgi:hypothetical protein
MCAPHLCIFVNRAADLEFVCQTYQILHAMQSSSAKLATLAMTNLCLLLLNIWFGLGTRRLGKALLDLQRAAGDGEEIGIFCRRGQRTATLTLDVSHWAPSRVVALNLARILSYLVQLRRRDCELQCRAVGVSRTSSTQWSRPTVQIDVDVFLCGHHLPLVNTAGGAHHITLFCVSNERLADQVVEELQELLGDQVPFDVSLGESYARQPMLTQTSRLACLPHSIHCLIRDIAAEKRMRWHNNTDQGNKLHVAL